MNLRWIGQTEIPCEMMACFLPHSNAPGAVMLRLLLAVLLAFTTLPAIATEPVKLIDAPQKEGFSKFRVQEIDAGLKIGYAVIVVDIDGDKKPDIVVVDQHQVVWYQNPTWKKRVILDGKTKPDNVCITALDIDGDGLPELVVGAAWKPFDTRTAATIQWLQRGKTLDEPWSMHDIPCDEPTVHRVRTADIDGDGKPEIVMVPLMGRESTKEKNWMDGRPLRMVAWKVPAEPTKLANWKAIVLSDSLHVAHNFHPFIGGGFARKGDAFVVGSYEGVSMVYPEGKEDKWTTVLMHEANQATPKASRGASEIKRSTDKLGAIATIEPWHGNQVVAYTPAKQDPEKKFSLTRTVIDEQLRWGHAVSFADLDGDGVDELVIGVRDDPNAKLGDTFTERRGVRIYKRDDKGLKWDRHIIENGGVAVEDLTVADLDGDRKPDIIAVGRATGNCRIYWNVGK